MPLPRPIDKLHYSIGLERFTINEPTPKQITDEILSLNGEEKCFVTAYIADHAISIMGGNNGRVAVLYQSFGMAKSQVSALVSTGEAIANKLIEITYQGEVDVMPFQDTVTKEIALVVALALYQVRGFPAAPSGTMWRG